MVLQKDQTLDRIAEDQQHKRQGFKILNPLLTPSSRRVLQKDQTLDMIAGDQQHKRQGFKILNPYLRHHRAGYYRRTKLWI